MTAEPTAAVLVKSSRIPPVPLTQPRSLFAQPTRSHFFRNRRRCLRWPLRKS
jgi:hypothetical protein